MSHRRVGEPIAICAHRDAERHLRVFVGLVGIAQRLLQSPNALDFIASAGGHSCCWASWALSACTRILSWNRTASTLDRGGEAPRALVVRTNRLAASETLFSDLVLVLSVACRAHVRRARALRALHVDRL